MALEVHKSVTLERVMRAAKKNIFGTSNKGFCIKCGKESNSCEPDAEEYKCERCGRQAVYAAEVLISYF
jgi:tRNA(Ile2) C34 agmatinyltransferase TiaS